MHGVCTSRRESHPLLRVSIYRVRHLPGYLGWVELDLGCSTILLGQLVATEAAHQPGELPKSKLTQPSRSPDAPDCTISRKKGKKVIHDLNLTRPFPKGER